MQKAIGEIINRIPKGVIFDSHYVISCLIKFHSDDYLNFATDIEAKNRKTLAVHGNIGQTIATFEPKLIKRLTQQSYSENIHGESGKCTAWLKK